VRHEARLDALSPDGKNTVRSHLLTAARKGHRESIEALTPPEFADGLEYLLGWANELHGRSGVGMSGAAPLSYPTLQAWAGLMGRDPAPYEVEALMMLDAAMLNPGEPESEG
jgi:hypothetical protein